MPVFIDNINMYNIFIKSEGFTFSYNFITPSNFFPRNSAKSKLMKQLSISLKRYLKPTLFKRLFSF